MFVSLLVGLFTYISEIAHYFSNFVHADLVISLFSDIMLVINFFVFEQEVVSSITYKMHVYKKD